MVNSDIVYRQGMYVANNNTTNTYYIYSEW